MKKNILLLLFIISTFSFADEEMENKEMFRKQAYEMIDYFKNSDYENYFKYILPELVEANGGLEELREITESIMEDLKNNGVTLENIIVEKPEKIVAVENGLQGKMKQIIKFKTEEGYMNITTYLVGVKYKDKNNCYFIDMANKSYEEISCLVEELSPELDIEVMENNVEITKE